MNLDIINNSTCNIKVESSVGTVQLSSDLPLVLGCQEPIAEWKIPSMRGIMAARAKNIVLREPQFGFGLAYINDEVNDQQRKGQMFQRENLNELIEIIKKEVRA
jgi:electron transfer flavoprotein beta subunit